jgi:hypothetical protein
MLTLAFSKNFDFFHLNKPEEKEKLKEYDYVISLVRNPIDSISSIVAMQMEFNSSLNVNDLINTRIEEYINFYSFVLNGKNTFINFDDIEKNINKIIKYVSNISGYDIINSNPKDIVKDTPSQNFLKSSKKSTNYDYVRSVLINKNLYNCEGLYNLSLSRCVKIDAI